MRVQGVAGVPSRALRCQEGRGVVEACEELVGLQVQCGQRADDGAQLSHGGGGLDAAAGDLSDDQGGAGAGQGNRVEPASPAAGSEHVQVGGFDSAV